MEYPKRSVQIGATVLKIEGVTRSGIVQDISFELHKGEILGLAGLVGSGRTEIAEAIFGAEHYDGGVIEVNGKKVVISSTADGKHNGIGLLTEDRKETGLILSYDLIRNISITNLNKIKTHKLIDTKKERELTTELAKELDVKTPSMVPDEEYPNANIINFRQLDEELRAEGTKLRRIGFVGTATIPHQVYVDFKAGFEGVELVDITDEYETLRAYKTPWEVDQIQHSNYLCDMIAEGIRGRIINTSSSVTKDQKGQPVDYCIAKAGINVMTTALARELGPYGITVNAILPGAIPTKINRWQFADPKLREQFRSGSVLGELGAPEYIAGAVKYFISDEAHWTTGVLLSVDGGYTI